MTEPRWRRAFRFMVAAYDQSDDWTMVEKAAHERAAGKCELCRMQAETRVSRKNWKHWGEGGDLELKEVQVPCQKCSDAVQATRNRQKPWWLRSGGDRETLASVSEEAILRADSEALRGFVDAVLDGFGRRNPVGGRRSTRRGFQEIHSWL